MLSKYIWLYVDQCFPCQSHAKHWHVAWSLSYFLLYFTLPDFRARHRRLTRIANSTYHGLCMTPTTLWTWPRTQKEFTAGRHEAFTNSRIISSTDHDFHSYSMGRSCKIVAPVGAITFIWHAEPGFRCLPKGSHREPNPGMSIAPRHSRESRRT